MDDHDTAVRGDSGPCVDGAKILRGRVRVRDFVMKEQDWCGRRGRMRDEV